MDIIQQANHDVDTFIRQRLSTRAKRLINLASWDLNFGPITEDDPDSEDWPGFQAVCSEISEALEPFRELWYDTQTGWVETESPCAWESCQECAGSGIVDYADETACETLSCPTCDGSGNILVDLSDWMKFDHPAILRTVTGSLASYLG